MAKRPRDYPFELAATRVVKLNQGLVPVFDEIRPLPWISPDAKRVNTYIA